MQHSDYFFMSETRIVDLYDIELATMQALAYVEDIKNLIYMLERLSITSKGIFHLYNEIIFTSENSC